MPFQNALNSFAGHDLVGETRGKGLLGAVELVADKSTGQAFEPARGVGAYCAHAAQERGLIVRNLGDSIAFCPPIIISDAQVDELFEKFAGALDDTKAWLQKAA